MVTVNGSAPALIGQCALFIWDGIEFAIMTRDTSGMTRVIELMGIEPGDRGSVSPGVLLQSHRVTVETDG